MDLLTMLLFQKNVRVDRYKIIRNTVMNMYPSDHYPIIVDVLLKKR